MTESSRKGVRLPWLNDQEETVMELPRTGNGAEADQADTAMTPRKGAAAPGAPSASQAAAAAESAEPAVPAVPAEPAAAPQAAAEASEPFLDDLVQAMRQITEQARDEAMAQLRASASNRAAELRTATEVRATELRELADTDVEQIGEWEKGETERIGAEAAAKVAARKTKLDSQIKANTASGEGAMSAVQARIEAFEREMSAFFAQLNDLHDPVAFASAVKRMPRPPSLADTPAAPSDHTAPAPTGTPTAAATPTAVEPATPVEAASTAGEATAPAADPTATTAEAEATPASAEAWPGEPAVATEAAPVETPAEPEGEEATTQVLVTGLTSFGAITSFKQSLERVAGIRRVSMGLGTSGEFIFTAAHGVGFDVAEAIRSFESSAQFVATDDQLRVTVGAKD
jgi:DNA-binding transcriptional regulator YiaG